MNKTPRILITGSSGLIGSALRRHLALRGFSIVGLDLKGSGKDYGDIRDRLTVRRAIEHCDGVIHLAAVSRVVWAERNPDGCLSTNVHGLSVLLCEAERCSAPPWFIFSSSREVYGEVVDLPVSEDAPLRPVNVYGRSKAEGELILNKAGERGLRTAVVRLSNVYGSTGDHPDRVIPAFARAAATGGQLRVEGGTNTFDFTHLDDTVAGLLAIVEALAIRHTPFLPPIQLVTGTATSLAELATLAVYLGNNNKASILNATPRTFDVSQFCGNPSRAKELLGWESKVRVCDGLKRLIDDFSEMPLSICQISGDHKQGNCMKPA